MPAEYGADPAHVDKIRRFAQENKLQVLERGDEILRRTVTLAGTAAAMEKAFGIELIDYDHPDGSYRGRTGPIHVPEDCAPFVKGIFGLDDRPVAKPHFRFRNTSATFGARASTVSYYPSDVGKLYNFPPGVNGAGQVIGLIELGGGYRPADIQQYFEAQGMQPPVVRTSSVGPGQESSHHPAKRRRRGDVGHRSGGLGGAGSDDCVLLCAQHHSRFPGCTKHGGSRSASRAARDFNQLGRT